MATNVSKATKSSMAIKVTLAVLAHMKYGLVYLQFEIRLCLYQKDLSKPKIYNLAMRPLQKSVAIAASAAVPFCSSITFL